MSGIISAKERKRQIRQRRQSQSLQNAAASTTNNVETKNGDNAEERPSKHPRPDDSLSNLDNSYSRASTAYYSCDARDATLLTQDGMLNNDGMSSVGPQRSLFSAVMSRSSQSPHPGNSSGPVSNAGGSSLVGKLLQAANSRKPAELQLQKPTSNVSFAMGASTPTKTTLFNKMNSPAKSPGGYDIMKALDEVDDSNQAFYQEDGKEEEAKEQQGVEEHRVARVFTRCIPLHSMYDEAGYAQHENGDSNPLNAIIEETKPAMETKANSMHQEPIAIGLIDWSLKKRVRILSSSGSLPGTVLTPFRDRRKYPPPDEGMVHQLGVQYLSNSIEESHEHPSLEESALAKWAAATMYYQHPAIHPLPASVLLEKTTTTEETQSLTSFNNRSTYHRVRLSGVGSMGGLGASVKLETKNGKAFFSASFSNLLDRRICEWQEAFRSMYQTWKCRVRLLNKRHSAKAFDQKNLASVPDELSRCCFYSISPSQVILFRVGVSKEDGVIPMIVFSSTTAEFRSKLKSMGVTLKLLRSTITTTNGNRRTEVEFSEDMLDSLPNAGAETVDKDTALDLKAMRAANQSGTDNRPTEVEVSQKRKSNDNYSKASAIPPLYVSGDDDCDAVYELLLNTCGFSINGSYGSWHFHHDVPLLLCRSIGQCLNTVLRTLSVSARRDSVYWSQSSDQDVRGKQSHESVVELYGPLLPCAVRDLMCASVNWMGLDQKLDDSAFDAPTQPIEGKSNATSESIAKIHQVSMFLQAHEGEFSPPLTSTGFASSFFFNGSNFMLSDGSSRDTGVEMPEWHECNADEMLNSMMWDARSHSQIEYNTFIH